MRYLQPSYRAAPSLSTLTKMQPYLWTAQVPVTSSPRVNSSDLVYAVNYYPDLCRNLFIKDGVESFIFKGAQLMWPGVHEVDSLPADLNADDVLVIRRASDKKAVAVGALAVDVESVKGKTPDGVACYILHMEGDNLWACGSKTHLPPKYDRRAQEEKEAQMAMKAEVKGKNRADVGEEDPNDDDFAAFLKNKGEGGAVDMSKGSKIKNLPKELKSVQETKAKPAVAKGGKEKEDPKGKGKEDKNTSKGGKDDKKGSKAEKDEKKGGKAEKEDKKAAKKADKDKKKAGKKGGAAPDEESEEEMEDASVEEKPEEKEDDKKSDGEADESGDEGASDDGTKKEGRGPKGKGGKKTTDGKKEDKKEEEVVVTKEQMKKMDELISEAFFNACKLSLSEGDLPIECGKLWTDHIIKCKPSDEADLDLKISSYKKIGKFLHYLQKEKLLTYEEASKKNAVPKVTKIEFHHKKIADWVPTLTVKALEGRQKDEDNESNKAQKSWRVSVEVIKLFKPNEAVKVFLEG